MKKTLVYVTTLALLTASCSKNDSPKNTLVEERKNLTTAPYIKFENPDEFKRELVRVSQMQEVDYNNWKKKQNLSKTLYDDYLKTERLAENIGYQEISNNIDTNLYYVKNDRLFSKIGNTLSKVINENGIVQVGNTLIKYAPDNIFYALANEEADKVLSRPIRDLAAKNKDIGSLNGSGTVMRAVNPVIAKPTGAYTHTNFLKGQVFYSGSNRKFWIDLNENFIFTPQVVSGTTQWYLSYYIYYEFAHQKKVTFFWNSYNSSVNIQDISFGSGPLRTFPNNYYILHGNSGETLDYITRYSNVYLGAGNHQQFGIYSTTPSLVDNWNSIPSPIQLYSPKASFSIVAKDEGVGYSTLLFSNAL
jgi:hypothetical protein